MDEDEGQGSMPENPREKGSAKGEAKVGNVAEEGPDWVLPDTVRVTVKPKTNQGSSVFLPGGGEDEVAQSFQGAQVQVGQEKTTVNRVITQPVENVTVLQQRAIKVRNIVGEIRDITAEIITDKVIVQGISPLATFSS